MIILISISFYDLNENTLNDLFPEQCSDYMSYIDPSYIYFIGYIDFIVF